MWELFRGLNSKIKGRSLTPRLPERYAEPFSKSRDNYKAIAVRRGGLHRAPDSFHDAARYTCNQTVYKAFAGRITEQSTAK